MNSNFYEYDVSNYLPYFMNSEEGMNLLVELMNMSLAMNKLPIDNFTDLVDLDSMSSEWQPNAVMTKKDLSNLVEDPAYRSELYRQLIDGYRYKGTNQDIIDTVDNFDNVGWMMGDYFYPGYDKQYKSTYITNNIDEVFTHSKSRHSMGDRFPDGDLWTYGVINITTVDYLTKALRESLDKIIPAGVKYILTTYTDILGPNGDVLYLGPVNARQYIRSYVTYHFNVNTFNIPKMLPRGGVGNPLIHSNAFQGFSHRFPEHGTPKYYGIYTDNELENSKSPDMYRWFPFSESAVPEKGRHGEGVPISSGIRITYQHYAFCDNVSGRQHSGSFVTSDNKMNIDLTLPSTFRREFRITLNAQDKIYIPQVFDRTLIIEALGNDLRIERESMYLRKMFDYFSHNSMASIQEETLNMGMSRGIDGFEIETQGTVEHIAYASNVYGKEGFTVSPNTLSVIRAVGVYNDNEPDVQSTDFERYKWYSIVGNEDKAKTIKVAYSDNNTTFDNFSFTKKGSNIYIGIIISNEEGNPIDPLLYTWSIL